MFYVNKVKIVPLNIGTLLTPIGLAQWIADDGFFRCGLYLQTNSYTKEEVLLLIEVLKVKFSIESKIRFERKIQPVIYIPANQIPKLRLLVLNYMDISTHYKLGIK